MALGGVIKSWLLSSDTWSSPLATLPGIIPWLKGLSDDGKILSCNQNPDANQEYLGDFIFIVYK